MVYMLFHQKSPFTPAKLNIPIYLATIRKTYCVVIPSMLQ